MVIAFEMERLIGDTLTGAELYADCIDPSSMLIPILITIGILLIAVSVITLWDDVRHGSTRRSATVFGATLLIGTILIICAVFLYIAMVEEAELAFSEFMTYYNNEYGDFAMSEDYIRELGESLAGSR